MTDNAYRFNYHDDANDFLQWAYISLIAGRDNPEWEYLTAETAKGTDVVLTMQVNGIEVSAKNMMESLERNYHLNVDKKVASASQDIRLDEIEKTISLMESEIVKVMREKFQQVLGRELPEEEEW